MTIAGIKKGGEKRPPRIVLYGAPGIGKSSFAAAMPDPVFVTTEDGIDAITVDQFDRAETWAEFLGNVQKIVTDINGYKTLVIDTLNGASDLAAAHVCATQFAGNWGEKGFGSFGKGWAATSEEMRKLLPMLDTARTQGMTIVILAHTGVVSVKNPIDGDFDRFAPSCNKNVWARFSAWADIIMRADYEYTVLDKKLNKGRAVCTSTRILRCAGSIVEDVKQRVGYELPDILPLSYEAFAAALGQTGDTLPAVKSLWGLLSQEEQTKTLAYLGGSLDKAPVAKLKATLNGLMKRQADLAAANIDPKEAVNG